MVKGNTRQVVVAKSPDPKLFEQAIFLLREDALEKHGVGERELLEEARRVANGFVLHNAPAKRRRRLPPLGWAGSGIISISLWAAIGAAPVSLAWLITLLL